jgi:hypothetical protein
MPIDWIFSSKLKSNVGLKFFRAMLAQFKLYGTPYWYLKDVPAMFIQQGCDRFVQALHTGLSQHGSERKFTVHEKNRDGSSSSISFRDWENGLNLNHCSKFFGEDRFYLKNSPTPAVHSLKPTNTNLYYRS